MSKHTITVTHVYCHEPFKTKERSALGALRGQDDLLHLLHGSLRDLRITNDDKMRYLQVQALHPAGRSLLIETTVGKHSEPGDTYNVKTHVIEHQRTEDSSSTVPARALLLMPANETSGLLFFEHVSGRSPSADLAEFIQKSFITRYRHTPTLKLEALVEPKAWLQAAQLEAVTAVAYGWDHDVAGTGMGKIVGQRQTRLVPPKGARVFPDWLWQELIAGTMDRATLLGISDQDVDEVVVQAVAPDGREKRLVLGRERMPSVRYLLADEGAPRPSATEFLDYCLTEAPDLFRSVGATWDPRLARGAWSAPELAKKMELP